MSVFAVCVCVSICVELFMLPQHIFASPVVMFTKSKFKYMSCGGKAINMHAEMMWSLDVPVRGGGWAGGEGLQQMHTPASAPGSGGESSPQEGESLPATKPVAGLCSSLPLSPHPRGLEVPHGEGSAEGPHPCIPSSCRGAGESPWGAAARSDGRKGAEGSWVGGG